MKKEDVSISMLAPARLHSERQTEHADRAWVRTPFCSSSARPVDKTIQANVFPQSHPF
jgi:hypothetical protein